MEKINSKEYWDQRFAGNWEDHNGPRYTYFHGEVLLRHLPEWLISEINQQKLSVCDWGCAEGDAVNIFTTRFPESNVCGVDFAAPAIESAKKKYPGCKFFCRNWIAATPEEKYDIVYSSHTLEHFRTPFQVMAENLLPRAKRYLVVMVPFAENPQKMDPEHFFRFIPEVIPQKLGSWNCVFYKVINSLKEDDFWRGIQVLMVFANPENSAANLTLASMPGESAYLALEVREKESLCEKLQGEVQLEKEKRNLQKEHAKVILDQNTRLNAMVNSQKEGIAARDAKIAEMQKNITGAQAKINDLQSQFELEKEKRILQHQHAANILEQNQKLTGMLTAANNSFRESQQTLTKVNAELASGRAEAAALQQSLTKVNGELAALRQELADCRNKLTAQQQATAAANAEIAALNGKVTAAETKAAAANAEIAVLNGKVTAAENKTAAANAEIAALNGKVTAAENKAAAANAEIAALNGKVTAAETKAAAANARAGALTNDVAIAKAESKILRQRLEEKSAKCDTLLADNEKKSAACRELELIRQTKSYRATQKFNRVRAKVYSCFGIEYPRGEKKK